MANRSWGNQSQDWDPMRDDYNNSTFDPQYPDDNSGGGVQLDHSRLYVTNIPKTLNEEGMHTVFSKYGTLTETFLSRDQNKRFGLIKYETAGEAKLAMMKLNRAEPLKLVINIAHKQKNPSTKEAKERGSNHVSQISRDNTSICSRARNTHKMDDIQLSMNSEGDMDDLMVEDELGMDSSDPDLHLELVQLKMERIKLEEEKLECKRMMILNRAGRKSVPLSSKNRSVLSDGRIVVRNNIDRPNEATDSESFGVGSGDAVDNPMQLTLPGLQRYVSRACVSCGAPADAYCSKCGVTPYCSPACHQRDWRARHHAVCHNLARLAEGNPSNAMPAGPSNIPTIRPNVLRRPHSPVKNMRRFLNNEDDDDDDGSQARALPSSDSSNYQNGQTSIPNNNRPQNKYQNKLPGSQNTRPQNNPNLKPQVRVENNRSQNIQNITQMIKPQARNENRSQINQSKTQKTKLQDRIEKKKPQFIQNTKPQDNIENRANISPLRRPQIQIETDEDDWTNKTPSAVPSNIVKVQKKSVKTIPDKAMEEKKIIKPLSVKDVTPTKKFVPKTCLVETLAIGDIVLVSVDKVASECRVTGPGYIGVSLHKKYEADYMSLCEEFGADCDKEGKYTPVPGEAFSYYNDEDCAWYRARCLTNNLAALIDGSAVVTMTTDCRQLPHKYADIPEFSCYININGVDIGDSLKCILKAKLKDGYKVIVENVTSGASVGEGEVKRWCPEIEYPVATAVSLIAEISRPDVCDKSRVFLVEATDLKRAFVRSADVASQRRYDSILQDVVLYGQSAKPLTEPPSKGELVIAKYTDGLHYRAVCKRTNVKQNKYLLEYVEFGNLEISKLQDLYPCPEECGLSAQPPEASQVSLLTGDFNITTNAMEYIEKLKDSSSELILTIPSGAKTAPSGVEVKLVMADTKDCVNTRLEALCTAEWKKMEKIGADVVQAPCVMYDDLELIQLPEREFELEVLDISSLEIATITGYRKGEPLAKMILEELPEQLEAYCNSDIGKEPYLPKAEELCIAQCPPYTTWYRAVFCEQVSGAGGVTAQLCYVDYGNVENVSVSQIRKMLPEFVDGIPALAAHCEIKDFPKNPSEEQLMKATKYMEINEEGRGRLKVVKCTRDDSNFYLIEAPELIAAIM